MLNNSSRDSSLDAKSGPSEVILLALLLSLALTWPAWAVMLDNYPPRFLQRGERGTWLVRGGPPFLHSLCLLVAISGKVAEIVPFVFSKG